MPLRDSLEQQRRPRKLLLYILPRVLQEGDSRGRRMINEDFNKSQILQRLMENQRRFAEGARGQFYPRTFEEFRRRELSNYMKREKGKKRLRKKKALKRMREVWALYSLVRPIRHFVNYQELGKKLFPVEPFLDGGE